MITCPNCNKELEDGTKFCNACGAQIFETVFCPNCGEQTSTEFAFCRKCGAALGKEAEISAASAEKNPPKGFSKKYILFGGIGMIVLTVIILAVSMFSGVSSNSNYGLYLKDDEIVYTDFSEKGTWEITSRLVDDESISDSELAEAGSYLGFFIAFSDDGNRIFFPDRIDDDGMILYYRNINKPDEDAVKIDSDVLMYAINGDGTKIVYVKGEDRTLYLHDLTDKTKIARDVVSFHASDDLKKIGYQNSENSYYLWYEDQDSEKLASDITSIEHVASDLSVIYYLKDGDLYKQTEDREDREKIASDVSRIIAIYDSGEVYYTRRKNTEKTLMDYVDDDMAALDIALTKPEIPDYPDVPQYPSWWDYDTDEEYRAAEAQYEIIYENYEVTCDQLRAEYDAARDAYNEKLSRDSLREELRTIAMDNTEYTLYYFNGIEEALVTDALVSEWGITCADDQPVMLLKVYNRSAVQKLNLSEINSSDEADMLIQDARNASMEKYVAVGSALSMIEQTDADMFEISSDGSTVYFLDDISDRGNGDLYKIAITDGQVGKPEMYDSDVSKRAISFNENNTLTYYKNVNNENDKGDLFINGKEIDYDVYFGNVSYLDDAVLYYTDYSYEKGYGTLKMSKDGTNTKIADDVHDFNITNDGDILYLYDYSTSYHVGTLYQYKNGTSEKIDDDVIALIPVHDHGNRGWYY